MGQRLVVLTVSALAIAVPSRSAPQLDRSAARGVVLASFTGQTDETIDDFLIRRRPAPLDPVSRGQVLASLPKDGELRPSASEIRKFAAAQRILDYSARGDVIRFKVFTLDHARVGLYQRTVVLVSRFALDLVSPEEFAALVAHELAHEYVWAEYEAAMQQADSSRLQRLELYCDGLAVLILRRVEISPDQLVSAVQTITRYNERRGATKNAANYVSLTERVAFIRAIARLGWPDAASLLMATEVSASTK